MVVGTLIAVAMVFYPWYILKTSWPAPRNEGSLSSLSLGRMTVLLVFSLLLIVFVAAGVIFVALRPNTPAVVVAICRYAAPLGYLCLFSPFMVIRWRQHQERLVHQKSSTSSGS